MVIYQIITIMILAVLMIAGAIVTFQAFKRLTESKSVEANYLTFHTMGARFIPIGIIWTAVSLASGISFVPGIVFTGLGVTYLTIGLVNRGRWRK